MSRRGVLAPPFTPWGVLGGGMIQASDAKPRHRVGDEKGLFMQLLKTQVYLSLANTDTQLRSFFISFPACPRLSVVERRTARRTAHRVGGLPDR